MGNLFFRGSTRSQLVINIGVALFLAVYFGFLTVRSTHEYRFSGWANGDAQALIGARQFAEDGFIHHRFLPFVDPGFFHPDSKNDQPRGHYGHYPSLHVIVLGALAHFVPDPHLHVVGKILSSFFSTLALLFLFACFRRFDSPLAAFVAILFVGLEPISLEFADSLANQPMDEFFRAMVFFLNLKILETHKNRYIYLLWFALFFLAANSIEYILSTLFVTAICLFRQVSMRVYLGLLISPLVSFGLHFAQVVWEWGSFRLAVKDWVDIFLNRSTGMAQGTHSPWHFAEYPTWVENYLFSLRACFRWMYRHLDRHGFYPLVIFFYLGSIPLYFGIMRNRLFHFHLSWRPLLSFLVGGFIFLFVFPVQLRIMDRYTFRHFLPVLVVLLLMGRILLQQWTGHRKALYGILSIVMVLLSFNLVRFGTRVKSYLLAYPNLVDRGSWTSTLSLAQLKTFCSLREQVLSETKRGDIILFALSPAEADLLQRKTSYLIENCLQRRILFFGPTEQLDEIVDHLRKYRKEFVTIDPRVSSITIYKMIHALQAPITSERFFDLFQKID